MRRLFLLSSTIFLITLLVTLGLGYQALNNLIQIKNSQPSQTKTLGVETKDSNDQVASYVTLIINAGEGISSSYLLDAKEGTTVYSLLTKAQETGGIDLEIKQYDFGVLVNSINGFENSSEHAWIYFVNGKSGDVACDKYFLKSGDKVEWKYMTSSGE
ncbi:hypothetical protein A2Z22_04825 [Candidatus Woesebacteria bacterium RBG_16_34_12]|uniref:Transcobalamin-like C-terminal domain-containing protein n=1 Tax=Candidatus Woesebacteria bacterium RBG_16_34_12 TaxID=1802480 RepID=A0A1F7XAD7_9BACT|nr:MAG: hypothetical protein A2Z22_04825 [Candidatus Woesebacteria bacterium RBG_16_34_12]